MQRERKLNRLRGYDYSQNGMYFVTICAQDRMPWFGNNHEDKMCMSEFGLVAQTQWLWLANHFEYVVLDEYIIMPDHIHGIIQINTEVDRSLQKIKPLPELIGAFKTTTAKFIHRIGGLDFRWQKSYFDHIIRNQVTLNRIREYIQNNPREHRYL